MFGSIRVLNSIDIIIYLYQILSRHDDFKNHTGDWQVLTLSLSSGSDSKCGSSNHDRIWYIH